MDPPNRDPESVLGRALGRALLPWERSGDEEDV